MIRFLPIENDGEAEKLFGENTVVYRADSPFSMQVFFKAEGYQCFILGFSGSNDGPAVAEGLIRSALNYAALRGAFTARVTAASLPDGVEAVFERLGFKTEQSVLTADIPDVLTCSCKCAEKI